MKKQPFLSKCCLFFIVAMLMVASSAQAMGIIVPKAQRFNPAMDDFGALTAESDKTLGFGEVALGVHLNVSHEPLDTGDVKSPISDVLVKDLYTANLTAAYGIAQNFQIGIDVPFNATFSNMNAVSGVREDNFSTGDVRLKAKFRVFSGESFGVALIPFVNLSTGKKDLYLSEGRGGYGVKVATHADVTQSLTLYANAGVELLGNSMSTGSPDYYSKWMQYAVGASYGFKEGKHKLIAEVNSETTLSRPYRHEWHSPVELLGALRCEIKPGLSVQLGAGTGLNNGMGAPLWRAFSGLYYRF